MKDIKNYSGKQVIKAGEMLIDPDITDDKFEEALDILSYWRFSHEKPLADALNLLQSISLKIDKSAIFVWVYVKPASFTVYAASFYTITCKF